MAGFRAYVTSQDASARCEMLPKGNPAALTYIWKVLRGKSCARCAKCKVQARLLNPLLLNAVP